MQTVDAWLEAAQADAAAANRSGLAPLLASLAEMTRQLRAADWNIDATGASGPGPLGEAEPSSGQPVDR